MTLVTGYLPVFLNDTQHKELNTELSKHYTAEYFDIEELHEQFTTAPPYTIVRALQNGLTGVAHYKARYRVWLWNDPFPTERITSLLKLS